MFRVAPSKKFCVLLTPGDSTKLGGHFGFAVWGLSGYIGSWDSGHRLCTCWPVTKSSETSLPLPESQGRAWPIASDLPPCSDLWLVWVPTTICFLQTRSRPLDTGRCSRTSTAVILQSCVQSCLLVRIICLPLPSAQPSLKKILFH